MNSALFCVSVRDNLINLYLVCTLGLLDYKLVPRESRREVGKIARVEY